MGRLDRGLFLRRVASSPADLCPVGLDPQPDRRERDYRDHFLLRL
jgi:hypothetical protein